MHQDHEPRAERRGLQPVLVEHAVEQPWIHRRDGEALLAIQGVNITHDCPVSVGRAGACCPGDENE